MNASHAGLLRHVTNASASNQSVTGRNHKLPEATLTQTVFWLARHALLPRKECVTWLARLRTASYEAKTVLPY